MNRTLSVDFQGSIITSMSAPTPNSGEFIIEKKDNNYVVNQNCSYEVTVFCNASEITLPNIGVPNCYAKSSVKSQIDYQDGSSLITYLATFNSDFPRSASAGVYPLRLSVYHNVTDEVLAEIKDGFTLTITKSNF